MRAIDATVGVGVFGLLAMTLAMLLGSMHSATPGLVLTVGSWPEAPWDLITFK